MQQSYSWPIASDSCQRSSFDGEHRDGTSSTLCPRSVSLVQSACGSLQNQLKRSRRVPPTNLLDSRRPPAPAAVVTALARRQQLQAGGTAADATTAADAALAIALVEQHTAQFASSSGAPRPSFAFDPPPGALRPIHWFTVPAELSVHARVLGRKSWHCCPMHCWQSHCSCPSALLSEATASETNALPRHRPSSCQGVLPSGVRGAAPMFACRSRRAGAPARPLSRWRRSRATAPLAEPTVLATQADLTVVTTRPESFGKGKSQASKQAIGPHLARVTCTDTRTRTKGSKIRCDFFVSAVCSPAESGKLPARFLKSTSDIQRASWKQAARYVPLARASSRRKLAPPRKLAPHPSEERRGAGC